MAAAQRLEGIIPPLVTPFDENGDLDEGTHRAEVRYLIEAGVAGLAVGGSTGEGHTLTDDELVRLAGAALEEASGRVPVIAGIITNSTRAAVERARALDGLPVAALQVTPVHYLFPPDEESSLRHFDTIAQRSGRPVIIYNVVPWSYLQPGALHRILERSDGVIGVKQSASDMKALADLLLLEGPHTPHRIFSAVDALLYPSFALGAHGAIAAILTAAPHWCVALWKASRRGDHAMALDLHARLLRLWNALEADNLPAAVKAALELQGRSGGRPRSPMPQASPAQRERIRRALADEPASAAAASSG